MEMDEVEALEILYMDRAIKPLFTGPRSRGEPEPARFALNVRRGLWERVGDGYIPTAAAIRAAKTLLRRGRFCDA